MGEYMDERRARRVRREMERAARRRSSFLPVVSVIALAVLLGLGLTARAQGLDLRRPGDLVALFQPRTLIEVDGQAMVVPQPAPALGRVLPAVPVASRGTHAFLNTTQDGAPVGYDPCRTVRYVVQSDGAPPEGAELVTWAVARISEATGLSFEYVGETDESADLDRALIQPDRYGNDWAPVLVAWATEAQVPSLQGDVAGIGGSAAVPGAHGDGLWLAAGRLVLDADDLGSMTAAGRPEIARAVVLHELGHVVGLDHVDDRDELMYPTTSSRFDLGPGDREGLALLGQVACQQ